MGKRFFKQTIKDVDVERQTVLVRVDYNVPLHEDGTISDDFRIRASLPTIKYLLDHQCKLVLMSHLGRPEGRDEKLSLAPVAARLAELLGRSVMFIDDCVGDKVRQTVRHAPCGSIILLENLRFYKEEEADDASFAKALVKSSGASFFVQDAFGAAHRAHASTHAITLCLPSFAGLLIEKEYTAITDAMAHPAHPLVAVVGGAKVSDKIELVERLITVADKILIGGAMANTFLKYKGYEVGSSVFEDGQDEVLGRIYQKAEEKVGAERIADLLVLPPDVAVGNKQSSERREVAIDGIEPEDMALDIGSRTIDCFSAYLHGAGTIIWNGPVGYTDNEVFSYGSARIALAVASNTKAISVVGGGDTADFVLKWDGNDGASFTHVSTGGGASLELMSGKQLPGIESLLDAYGPGVVH